MSNKRDLYFTVVFDALLEGTPEKITTVVYKWLFKDHGESVDIELIPQKGTIADIPIKLRPKEKRFKYSKHLYAGNVGINGDVLGSHVVIQFFDWETADNLSDACTFAATWDYAIVHNQQKIFEDLAQTLRREVLVLQDNLKEMKNENMGQDAMPEVVSVLTQTESGEIWLPWLYIPDEKNHRQIIELWCKGKNAKEIAKEVFIGAPTIYNIISNLRKSYPKARIPKDRERKSMRF